MQDVRCMLPYGSTFPYRESTGTWLKRDVHRESGCWDPPEARRRRPRPGAAVPPKISARSASRPCSASDHCDESRRFYERERAEGERHIQAVLARARRRLNVLWAHRRDGRTYELVPPDSGAGSVRKRTRWESTATVRVRYAAVDLSQAVLTASASVSTQPTPFTQDGTAMSEDLLANSGPQPGVSVQGVDAAHLVLTETNLTDRLFSGAFPLDQIRLEGSTTFAGAPTGRQGWLSPATALSAGRCPSPRSCPLPPDRVRPTRTRRPCRRR
ncbi:hypothetical protein GCM10009540_15690 [Streptomyces turgidiscabies]|nr:hypothetical protein T45_03147 [Streptomyces turgidiscabies]